MMTRTSIRSAFFALCIGATMISFPMVATSNASKYFQKVMKGDEEHSAMETIGQIVKLTNLPGWPDYFADDKTSRLPGNLGAAYDELTGV